MSYNNVGAKHTSAGLKGWRPKDAEGGGEGRPPRMSGVTIANKTSLMKAF